MTVAICTLSADLYGLCTLNTAYENVFQQRLCLPMTFEMRVLLASLSIFTYVMARTLRVTFG
jgi:hypothetical protein